MSRRNVHREGSSKGVGPRIEKWDREHGHRCKAELVGAYVRWEVDIKKTYSYAEAYRENPHWGLISAERDEDVRAWIEMWGPPEPLLLCSNGQSPLDQIRELQADMIWWVYLLGIMQTCGPKISNAARSALVASLEICPPEILVTMSIFFGHKIADGATILSDVETSILNAGERALIELFDQILAQYPTMPLGGRMGFGYGRGYKSGRLMLFVRYECFGLKEFLEVKAVLGAAA